MSTDGLSPVGMDPSSRSLLSCRDRYPALGTGPKPMISPSSPRRLAIVGRGRLGNALAIRLRSAGHHVAGPLGRDYGPAELAGAEAVLLCVPDEQIPAAAAVLAERCPADGPRLVGHCSGAAGLDVLGGGGEAFSLHPLMTVTADDASSWSGAFAAVSGSSDRALALASGLAGDLGLRPATVSDADRAAYHAAASMASNFLVTLEDAAERLAASAGADRAALVPLVQRTVENWARGGAAALTGPIARGDEATVARQREAVADRAPELCELFDAMAAATRALAGRSPAEAVSA